MAAFRWLVSAAARVAAALFVLAGAMLTYEVAARYFFTRPTIWAAELSQLCLVWGTMLAMAALLAERRHIRVDAVVRLLPAPVTRIVGLLAMLVVAGFAFTVLVYGFDIFHESWVRGRRSGTLLNLPKWFAEAAIPVGFALLFLQSLLEIRRLWLTGDDP